MIGSLFVVGASLVAVQGPLSGGEQSALDSLVEARREVGDGPAHIAAAISADLTGDGQPDVAAVYGYGIGPSRNRSGRQWITVLVATDGRYAVVGPWLFGSKGDRLVQTMEVQGDTIQLRGPEWLVGDPVCCPSGVFEHQLFVVDGRFRELRGSWRHRRYPVNGSVKRVSFGTQDGGIVFADVYGTGDRGVVLAHGGRFDKESWTTQAQVLATAGFRTVAIDFRGRGHAYGGPQSASRDDGVHFDVLAAVRYLHETRPPPTKS